MKLWSLFLPQVAKETYGAPEILQLEHIRNAAIEFCERSLAWQVIQDPYPLPTVILNTSPIMDFQVEAGVIVVKILRGELVGSSNPPLVARTPEWCDENYPGWMTGSQLGKPSNVTQISPDQWVPVPAATGGPWTAVLRVAYKPSRDSVQGPDFLYNDYLEQIASGAKGRLMLEAKKDWSNPTLGEAHMSVFDAACDRAKVRAAQGFGRGRVRVKSRFV